MTSLVPFFPQPEFLVDNTLCPHSLQGVRFQMKGIHATNDTTVLQAFPIFGAQAISWSSSSSKKNPLSRGCKAFLWSHFSDDNAGE